MWPKMPRAGSAMNRGSSQDFNALYIIFPRKVALACEGHNRCKLPAAYRAAARTRWPTEPPRPRPSRGIIGVSCQQRTAPLRAHGGQLSRRAIISMRFHSPLDISYKNENLNESSRRHQLQARIFEQFFMHAVVHNALIVLRLLYR